MNLFGEKIRFTDRKTFTTVFIIILSTFLLLFLYYNDVWRPVQYWLFLNGLILFIIPLLSLIYMNKKQKPVFLVISSIVILAILSLLTAISLRTALFTKMKDIRTIILLGIFFMVVTAVIVFSEKIKLREYGIAMGKLKFWVPLTVIFFVFMIPIIYWASTMPSFQRTYPMLAVAKQGIGGFIISTLSFGLFFIFWEYFFRGYMLFSLEKRVGFLLANTIQAMAFAFMHLGKPELEVYSSLAGGLIIGWLCWRSKSFLPAFFIHWGIQTTMDMFAVLR